MMGNTKSTLALVFSIISLVLALQVTMSKPEQVTQKKSVYDRVMETHTLRCAYQPWPPLIIKDPNTGNISGVFADITETMGKDLGLKIIWAEEVGSANIFEGFSTGRYDVLCSPISSTPQRAVVSGFTRAIGYVPLYLYARADDSRFDNAYEKANDDKISMMFMDGDLTGIVQSELFPKAKKVSIPNMTNGADLLVGVASLKADAAVNDPSIADVFMKNSPDKIKRVAGPPLRTMPINFALPSGEEKLRELLNQTISNYLEVGIIDRIWSSYGLDGEKILRVAAPYIEPPAKAKGGGQ